MKMFLNILPLLVSIITFNSLHAQTADEIVDRHIIAMGGKDKLARLNSVHMEMISYDGSGKDRPASVTTVEGKAYISDSEMGGQKIKQVMTSKGGYVIIGNQSPKSLTPEQLKQAESEIYVTSPFYNYVAKGSKVELLGKELVGDINAFKLKLTNKSGVETIYFIDPADYYIIKSARTMDRGGKQVTISVTSADFRKTDEGFVFAYEVKTSVGALVVTTKISSIVINPQVDPNEYAMPDLK